MSSFNVNSLSGLSELLARVDKLSRASEGEMAPEVFDELHELINIAQVQCPRHNGVRLARVKWYSAAVYSFNRDVVQVAVAGNWPRMPNGAVYDHAYPWRDKNPSMLAGTELLGHFLKRSYLGDHFPEFYADILTMYRRIARSDACKRINMGLTFARLADDLAEKLLCGRL